MIPINTGISLRHEELLERLGWLINLRWLTIVFIILAYLTATTIFNLKIEIIPLSIIIASITVYNTAFYLYIRRERKRTLDMAGRIAFMQSILDIIFLTAFIHWTSGIENPFIFYFIFHTIITSALLPKRLGFIQAFIICILIAFLSVFEYLEIIPHHPINGFLTAGFYKNPIYVFAVYFTFASTILISTFITASISENLAKKEFELKKTLVDLEDANLKLLEKDKLKSEYVMMVAHDIKSPLSSILSMADACLEVFSDSMDKRIKDMLIRIRQKADNLHRYAADLLNLSRIKSSDRLNLEVFGIKDVINESLEFAVPISEGKELDIKIDIPDNMPLVTADKEQMRYVFINLLSNAFKYTPDGGRVLVKAESYNETMNIEVSDTGIGIPQDDIPKIFNEFFRAGNVEKITKGTGLGLALVKYIIERHNGKILVESKLGKGTRFKVVLPIKQTKPSNNY
ncbi:MAG: HAMP domain-containing histidine kinase [Deltaproteobacteria bacterium]|nr:HAMP domain-containing histidine kinase [Deltaproteobacteria bacterium]